MTNKIEVRGLRKAFGAKLVLDGLDLDVPVGESVVIIGGSGTGKSVLLKCILGLIRPDAGSIRIDGEEVVGLPPKQRDKLMLKFGMLFQGGALFDSLRVWQNVAFGLIYGRGMDARGAKDIALKKLAAVGLGAEAATLRPSELSGGMQKRVALARALVLEPQILVYDEPTSGLDPVSSRLVDDLISETSAKFGVTSVVITHDMASVMKIGHHVNMLAKGKIEISCTPDEILRAENPIVRDFLAASGVKLGG